MSFWSFPMKKKIRAAFVAALDTVDREEEMKKKKSRMKTTYLEMAVVG